MNCAWHAYINLIPPRFRNDVDKFGKELLQEVRLRLGRPPELILKHEHIWLDQPVEIQELEFTVNVASRYSPWTAGSMRQGFLTSVGGHRVGICGEVVMRENSVTSVQIVTSVSIRVARDFPGIAQRAKDLVGSVLIVGSPGRGKTTLLRDVIRIWDGQDRGMIAVVDERREIFPMSGNKFCFQPGRRTDVLSGCSKVLGIEMLLRTMTPSVIAVDEITAREDCEAVLQAGWCGVQLLATVHAENRRELYSRPIYEPLIQSGLFQYLIVLQEDKSWTIERMDQ